jgi:16S rRNA (cytosine1402-N4)-methyltransferase
MSYRAAGPLDLRMDTSRGEKLAERLATATEEELSGVLRTHGDVGPARALARAILAAAHAGRLSSTTELAALAGRVLRDSRPAAVAPVFQALRVWVNDEMADLEAALDWLPGVMDDGAVVVTLAYHSGEDRRVKQALRGPARAASRRLPPATEGMPGPWEELTRRVVTSSEEEVRRNPRARSARMRAFRRKPR